MKNQDYEKLSRESDSFLEFTKKLVSVPKKEIDKQLELDRKGKESEKLKLKKRK